MSGTSAPEQLAYLLQHGPELATDIRKSIGTLQEQVQHLYTQAVQHLEKKGTP